jgi:DNA-directed RNA polymerase subunit beta'
LGIYYMTRPREFALGEGMTFASPEEVRSAYDQNAVHLQAKIKCRIRGKRYETTVGRVILSGIVPLRVGFDEVNKVLDKKQLGNLIDTCYRLTGEKETVLLADRIRSFGYTNATKAGISVALKDMIIPPAKQGLIEGAQKEVADVENQYLEGLITHGERGNKIIDIWAQTTEAVTKKMMEQVSEEEITGTNRQGKKETRIQKSFNPIFIMADSGARGSTQQIRQLAGMRGLMAKPSGEIIEQPIVANFREGLSVLEYFISTHGARKGLADTALKTANSGYLTRRLVDVAQDAIINEYDCGTLDGIVISALVEGGEEIEPLAERILGRVALDDIHDPVTGDVLVRANEEIDEGRVQRVVNSGLDKVKIRSVLTCQTRRGICVECYGRDLSRGRKVSIGEAIGVIAAQSIGEPGTQLTMRTFHVGGAATNRSQQSELNARFTGTVKFSTLSTVKRTGGDLVVTNRNGEIVIVDDSGRERERHRVVYGAHLTIKEGQKVEAGTKMAEWEPFAMPLLSEIGGFVKFEDIIDGVTMTESTDEVTGMSRRTIIESRDPDARPRITIRDRKGELMTLPNGQPSSYFLPQGAALAVDDGAELTPGEVVAKVPRETTKTKDITGGLPRVAELFEARKPKDHAIIAEIDGQVSFGKDTKGKRKLVVTPEVNGEARADLAKEYLIGKAKHITVHSGDRVRAGESLMDGAANPHDILKVLGEKELARFLVDEIQEVYRLQGVKINDKHIEVIVRQMLRRVRVTDVGDTEFLIDEQVEKWVFEQENEKALNSGKRPAVGEPLLLGITKASLSTESFISASSFQETTKVLTEAAISGKVDYLRGLKENVIMGRLVPAGTGLPNYRHLDIQVSSPTDEAQNVDDALAATHAGEFASMVSGSGTRSESSIR